MGKSKMFEYRLFKNKYKYKACAFAFLLSLLCVYPTGSFAQSFPECYPGQKNGSNIEVCPKTSPRKDLGSIKCYKEQSAGHCIDIIPADIPETNLVRENLCARGPTRNHNGMDIEAGTSATVKAAADGIFDGFATQGCKAGSSGPAGAGRIAYIKHYLPEFTKEVPLQEKPNTPSKDTPIVNSPHQRCFISSYMHLSSTAAGLTKGQVIKKGTPVGKAGGSGCYDGKFSETAYGYHLHFEMTDCSGSPIDPMCSDLMDLCPGGGKSSTSQGSISGAGSAAGAGLGAAIGGIGALGGQTTTNQSKSGDFAPHEKCRDCNYKGAYTYTCDERDGTHTSERSKRKGGGGLPAYSGGGNKGGADQVVGEGCRIQNYKEGFNECIFCQMFLIIFNTASDFAQKTFSTLQIPVINVVLLGFALWLAYTVVKHVSSLEQKDPRRMIKEILNQAAIVLFVIVLLLFGSTGVFSLFLEPVFNTGLKLAMLVADTSDGHQSSSFQCPKFEGIVDIDGGLPVSMGLNILCVIKYVQDMLMDIMSLGSTFMCVGFIEKAVIKYIFPHFGYALTGIALWVISLLILIMYPWLLIDAVLRMSIAVALFPAALGAAAFKMTRKYIGTVFGTFLTSMFNFVFLTIIIFLLLELIYKTVGGTIKNVTEVNDNSAIYDALASFGWWTVNFLKLGFVLILTYAIMGDAEGLANSFGGITGGGLNLGSGGKGIGSSVGTSAVSAAKEVSRVPRKMASDGLKNARDAAKRNISSAAHSYKVSRNAKKIENSKNSIKNADGSVTKLKKNWRGKVVGSETVKRGANGQPIITKSVTKGNKTITTETSKLMSVTKVVDNKTGQQIGEKFDMKDAALKKMLNKKGEMDMVAMNNLLQNSGHSQEDCLKGAMSQVLKERHGNSELISSDFRDRKVEIGKDEKGNTTFSLTQINSSGREQRFNMTLGEKRVRTEVETIGKNNKSTALISDGMINITSNRKYNDDRTSFKSKNTYSINSHYDTAYKHPIKGNKIDKKAYGETMMTDNELKGAIHQKKKYGNLTGNGNYMR